MKRLLVAIFLSVQIIVFSQNNDFSEIDNYISSLNIDRSITIPDLTGKLTSPFHSDLQKVRAVFFWIATNIRYDDEENDASFRARYPSDMEKINTTYSSRKGVCSGYSHLFRYMLGLSGIRCNVITGYARNDLKTCFPKNPNHAWNSVKIDNSWYLFDVTWARDSLRKVNDLWFMTDPGLFIMNHYPEYKPYTLMKESPSLEEFMHFPVYTKSFYDLKFTDDISKTGHFTAVNDTVTIHIRPNLECVLLTKLFDVRENKWLLPGPGGFVNGPDHFKLFIPKKGEFVLKLGALKQEGNSTKIYDDLIYYTIENK